MKNSFFLLITLLFLQFNVWAQPDTLIGENTFKYKIQNGEILRSKHVIIQNTYDLSDKILWQTLFRDSLMNIKEYTAFIYDNELLLSAETYNNNDSVIAIKRYSYTSNNNLSNILFYKRINNKMKLVKQKKYHYKDTLLLKKETLNRKNKWLKRTTYTYTDTTIIENIQFKKGSRDDKLKSKQTTSQLKDGIVQSSIINSQYYTGKMDTIKVDYDYDPKINKLIKEIWKDNSDSVQKIVEYRYNRDTGVKIGEGILDGSGNYLEFLGFIRNKRAVIMKEVKMYDLNQKNSNK